jgi:hypothetical protein
MNGIRGRSCIAVVASWDTGGGLISSCADDLSVAGNKVVSINTGGFNQQVEIYSFANYDGGNRVFTLSTPGNNLARFVLAIELFGVDRFNPLDGFVSGTGTSAAPATPNVTPIDDDTYVLAATNANGPTPVAPFTDIQDDGVSFTYTAEYRAPVGGVPVGCTWSQASSLAWQAIAATFRPDRNLRMRA